ncbi:MAG: hypothetical protein MJD61_10775 [Proteobacteria bacterium]|nr:hypothetical protein [Pseudomonadota bacterium]
MSSRPPRPSPPPPTLPPKVVAEVQMAALEEELALSSRPLRQAILQHEIGSLLEHRLDDVNAAELRYRAALDLCRTFRPPLYALMRLCSTRGQDAQLAELHQLELDFASNDSDRALALVNRGCLVDAALGDPHNAAELFEQALQLDPRCHSAALMLEWHHRRAGQQARAERVVIQRAELASDPALRAELALEAAETHLRDGDLTAALTLLRRAAKHGDPWSCLERMERIARAHGDHACVVESLERRASLASDAARRRGHHRNGFCHYRDLAPPQRLAAALWREAARYRLRHSQDLPGTLANYEAAVALAPDDALLRLERLRVYGLADNLQAAGTDAAELLSRGASGPQAAALQLRVADFAKLLGDRKGAYAALRQGVAQAPDSVAAWAVLEETQLRTGQYRDLVDDLGARARDTQGEARAYLSWRAGQLAVDRLSHIEQARPLLETAVALSPHKARILRELYGAALRLNDHEATRDAAAALCELPLEDSEISALMRERYQLLSGQFQDEEAALGVLREALDRPACRDWAPHAACLVAALRRDHELLGRAHQTLAKLARAAEAKAAHLCAAARAQVQGGDRAAALQCLQLALKRSPNHAYASALLEELYLSAGETERAVRLLKSKHDGRAEVLGTEVSLLTAGREAEAADDVSTAMQSYRYAIGSDAGSLAPLWALGLLGERLGSRELTAEALHGLVQRDRAADRPSIAALELGEHLAETGEQPERTANLLVEALDAPEARTAAALTLLMLNRHGADDRIRRAFSVLQSGSSPSWNLSLLREQAARCIHERSAGEEAWQIIQDVLAQQPRDRWARMAAIRTAPDAESRADAFGSFAATVDDRSIAEQLSLHGLRARAIALRGQSNDDMVMEALAMAAKQPSSLAASIAVDELLDEDDDPAARAAALACRIDHSALAFRPALQSARARALLAAGSHAEAAAVLRELLERDPEDMAAWDSLRVAARALGDWPAVVHSCDTLAARCEGEFRAMLLEEAAIVLIDELKNLPEGERRLREALQVEPSRRIAYHRLYAVVAERADTSGLRMLLEDRIAAIEDPGELSGLFFRQAQLLRALGERRRSLEALENLLMLDGNHAAGLSLLAEVHTSLEQWPEAVDALRALAAAKVPPRQRKLALLGAAEFLDKKLNDPDAALQEFLVLVRAEPGDASLHERMADLAMRAENSDSAAHVLCRVAEGRKGEERAGIERRAAAVFLKAGDATRAAQRYRRALDAFPADAEACAGLRELTDNPVDVARLLSAFERGVRVELHRRPTDPAVLRKLRLAAVWEESKDLELRVLAALNALGAASNQESERYQALFQITPRAPRGVLRSSAFEKLRVPAPTELAKVGRLACAALLVAERPSLRTFGVDDSDELDPEASHRLRDALLPYARVFGAHNAHWYVGGDQPRLLAALQRPRQRPVWLLGSELDTPLTTAELFTAGKLAFALHDHVLPLVQRSPEQAATVILAACAAAGARLPSRPGRPDLLGLKSLLRRAMPRDLARELASAAAAAGLHDADVEGYCLGLHKSSVRAGLLACGDLSLALASILEDFERADVESSDQARDVTLFWLSTEMHALRRHLELAK